MAEFQQNLGAEMMGGMGGGSTPAPAPAPKQRAKSPGSPKTAEKIAASPYARLQMLAGKAPPHYI